MGLKKKRLEPDLGVNQGFASAQWSAPPCWQRCQVPCCWRRSPEGLVPACSIPFEGSPAFPAPVPLLQRRAVLEQDGLLLALGVDLGICGIHICSQRPSLLLMCCLHKNQKYMPLPHLDATLNQNHLYPLKLSICLGYCSLLHSVELRPRAGRVGANVWHEPRQGLWWSQLQLETWTIFEALPPEKSMLLHVWAMFFPRSWALLYATATALSPMWSCIMIKWEPDVVPGSNWDTCQATCPLCPFVPLRKHVNAHSPWGEVQASHIPSVSFTGPPNSLGDYSSQNQTPGQGHPVCALPAHCLGRVSACVIFILLWVSFQGCRSQPDYLSTLPTWFHMHL